MRYRLLGRLEVTTDDGTVVGVSRPKHRVLLAVLLTSANGVVATDRLVDALWQADPPRSARHNLSTYIRSLRVLLEPATPANAPIVTGRHGYGIAVEPGQLDIATFERLVADGHRAYGVVDTALATRRLEEALALWRGPAFEDIPGASGVIAAEQERLEELRLAAVEMLMDAWISAGRHAEAVAELQKWAMRQPYRERLWELLMLALYRGGSQTRALAAYRRLRSFLIDETGVEPSPQLQALHHRILNGDHSLLGGSVDPPTGPHPPAPRHLPARPQLFAGRLRELAAVTTALTAPAEHGGVALACIVGAGGVGKTWLALRWAHDNLDLFPDGQLYVNLRGFDPSGQPVAPKTAVRLFLDALGVPAAAIPTRLEAQIGLYRSLLFGKRILILLDNARDADQVRPLLPGQEGCAVIATSRDRLSGLVVSEGAQTVTLDLMTPHDARQLLARRVGAQRLSAEPGATADIIEQCVRLPLAIAMVAARATTQPDTCLATFAAELKESHNRLDTLGLGGAGDIRAVFSCSYRTLDAAAARTFRLLALHPGADVGLTTVASLAGVPPHRAEVLLAELTRANLALEEPLGRYTLHDLLRAYATELAQHHDAAVDRELAIRRVLGHYLHTAHGAYVALDRHRDPLPLPELPPDVTVDRLTNQEEALRWYATEHGTLVATVDLAVSAGLDRYAWQLAVTLDGFFHRSGHWQDWLATKQVALEAARRLADRSAEAFIRCRIAEAYAWIGQHWQIAAHLFRAGELYEQLDDTAGRAYVHLCMGWVHEPRRRFQEALGHAEQSLILYRAAGDARGCANALNNIGWYHAQLGDYHRAIACCERALGEQLRVGTPSWKARTWLSLGVAYHRLGDHRQAVHCHQNALAWVRAAGHRYHEARILGYLSNAHEAAADFRAADDSRREAMVILRELDHPHPDRLDAPIVGRQLSATGS
jgi:DNA-binding SARP family transcriptional activator/tetratricopeptide (TPR) repeat protein